MPQLPLTITRASGRASVMSSSDVRMSEAPTPQFAPTATGSSLSPSAKPWISCGAIPIMVRPAVSKDAV